jgi:hypothetical protein
MTKHPLTQILIAAVLIIAAILLTSNYHKKKSQLYEQQLELLYKSRQLELTRQLEQTNKDRHILSDSIANLNRSNKTLRSADSLKTVQLLSIKGKYQNHTSKQLQDLMIQEFNQNK